MTTLPAKSTLSPPGQVLAMEKSRIFFPFEAARSLRISSDYRETLRSSDFVKQVIDDVAQIVEREEISILSFDVFDTALIRNGYCEGRRFYGMAKKFAEHLGNGITAEDVLLARLNAARAAYSFAHPTSDGTREGKLQSIAAITCSQLGVASATQQYIRTELQFEKETLRPNPLVLAIIDSLPRLRSIFLSDMYLSSAEIAGLLAPGFGKKLAVISSADGFGSKRAGGLYEHAVEKFAVKASQVLHFGDSLESDYRSAKRKGLHAYFLPMSDQERLERKACHDRLIEEVGMIVAPVKPYISFNY